MCHHRPLSTPS
jgi:serine/threonine protein kinase